MRSTLYMHAQRGEWLCVALPTISYAYSRCTTSTCKVASGSQWHASHSERKLQSWGIVLPLAHGTALIPRSIVLTVFTGSSRGPRMYLCILTQCVADAVSTSQGSAYRPPHSPTRYTRGTPKLMCFTWQHVYTWSPSIMFLWSCFCVVRSMKCVHASQPPASGSGAAAVSLW